MRLRGVAAYLFVFFLSIAAPGLAQEGPSSPDLPGLLTAGQALYRDSRYADARGVFLQAVEAFPRSALAHCWLGTTLYALERDKDALAHFQRAVKLDGKLSEGYMGVGRVYLRMPRRRLEARAAFERAARLAPDNADAQDGIGLTYVSTLGRKREYGVDGRRYFRKAIELDGQHPNAYYHLGLTYEESPARDYKEAMPYYFQQLLATPSHREALDHLVRCVMKTGLYAEGVRMVAQLGTHPDAEDNPGFETFRAQVFALALQEDRDFASAYEMYETYLTTLDSGERNLFTDLALVAPADMAQRYQRASDEDKKEIWRQFWAERDPDPVTEVNERLVEHYRRILYARAHFASAAYPWDRRGEIYIRYGEPDDRQPVRGPSGDEASYFPTGDGRVDAIREINRRLRYQWDGIGFTESWVYVPYNVEILFADRVGNGIFDYPPPAVDIRADRFHPKAVMADLIARQAESYRYDYGGEPMEFLFDVVTYQGADRRTEMEVAYSVPARQLGHTGDGLGASTWFDSHVVLRDPALRRIGETAARIGPIARPLEKVPKKEAKTNVRIAGLRLTAPPGRYRTAVAVRDSVSRRIGIYEAPVVVWDYTGEALNLSDIRLAASITPAAGPGAFVRNGLDIVPNPARQYTPSQPVYVYYEIYNLTRDETGRTAYRTDLEITAREKRMHLFWRILSGFGRLAKRTEDNWSVVLSFEGEGTEPEEHPFTSIETAAAQPGEYTLTLTVTDLHTGQAVFKTATFEVTE